LIPEDNVADLKDVSPEVKEKIQIVPVTTIEDVLQEALGIALPKVHQVLAQPKFFTMLNEHQE